MALWCLVGCATVGVGPGAPEGPPVHELPGELRALVSADPDGDGQDTLFGLEARRLVTVAWEGDGWILTPHPFDERRDWLGLTAGDVDGDGRDDLVMWSMRPHPWSVVLRSPAEPPLRISATAQRVMRAVRRDGGVRLLAQEPGTESNFRGPIRDLRVDDDGVLVRSDEPRRRPERDVLHRFYGPAADAEGDVLYTWEDGGILERREGRGVLWRSDTVRTSRPLAVERERLNLLGERRTELQEIPTEPLVADVDDDGTAEVLTVVSDKAPLGAVGRLRAFRGGSYRLLGVDGRGLAERARSVLIGRFATGVALHDVDGDGIREAVMSVVLRRRSGVSPGRSTLVVLDPSTGDLLPLGRPAIDP